MCDPALYNALGEIVRDGARSVRSIRDRDVLPLDTSFYEEPLSFDGMLGIGARAVRERLDYRSRWVRGTLDTLGAALHASWNGGGIECPGAKDGRNRVV